MKRSSCLLALLLVVGCSGSTDGPTDTTSDAALKKDAADRVAAGQLSDDPCAANGWYGDSVCDSFCFDADTDCQGSGEPVYCAEFIEVEDGQCGRPDSDPCRFQDPDCNVSAPDDPDGTVVCALYVEIEDGECSRPDSDPCRFQDPDCASDPGGHDCDTSKVTCQTFAEVTCPDGQVPTFVDGCYGPCVDKNECAPVACLAYVEVSDGTCSRADNDPCKSQDPDCDDGGGTVCAAYIEESDGTCSRSADDACIFQDPDCSGGGGVACAEYIEQSDGKCNRASDDPCIFQDPDCKVK